MKTTFAIIFLVGLSLLAYSQEESEFRSPLGIPLYLSGTFAELRSNHFHGGLDIKTNAKTGYRIYAAKEGYVSRIKVSPRGYGNALYVAHPNGYTTVYGHLSRFNDEITALVKRKQYQTQSFEQDIYLNANDLPVDRGEVIALSGNSGSSGGPHLHYEIRKTNGQIPINPMVYTTISDNINPTIKGLRVHELSNSFYHAKSKTYTVQYVSPGVYQLKEPVIVQQPVVAFSIKAIDKQNGTNNSNGFAALTMLVDDQKTFAFDKTQVPFDKSRYINAHIDYPNKKQGGGTYTNCFKLPGNYLNFYDPTADDGRIWLSQFPERKVVISIRDFDGNTSTLQFNVKYLQMDNAAVPTHSGTYFAYNQNNSFQQDDVSVSIPNGALYDDIYFDHALNPSITTDLPIYSNIHKIHTELVPLQKFMTVSLAAKNFPEDLRSKALMANSDRNGKIDVNTGDWIGDSFQIKTRNFGNFFITVDSKEPKIVQRAAPANNDYSKAQTLAFTISDDLSGIKSYEGSIDGQWVLFTYDAKRNLLEYDFDDNVQAGQHVLKLVVKDYVNNKKELILNFKR